MRRVHISKLEKEVNIALFYRSPKFKLTYAGTRFLFWAQKILNCQEKLQEEMEDIRFGRRECVRVGVSHARGQLFLPEVLPKFKEKYPLVDIFCQEGNFRNLQESLAEGKIDLYIGLSPLSIESVEVYEIGKEKLNLGVSSDILRLIFSDHLDENVLHSEIDIGLFKKFPFLLPPVGNRVRMQFDQYVEQAGYQINILYEFESVDTLYALAEKNLGVMVCSEFFARKFKQINREPPQMCFFPLPAENTMIIAAGRQHEQSEPLQEFIRLVTQYFKNDEWTTS